MLFGSELQKTAHQRLISKVQKLLEALIETQNYTFLSNHSNSISLPSPLNNFKKTAISASCERYILAQEIFDMPNT
jgi:hypothetical protein